MSEAPSTGLPSMPTGLGDFIKTGTLYKKRGGFFRNVPQQNWVPRTFALTHSGLLLYYEAATITEASAAPGGGLTAPRQILDLRKGNVTWACPSASDADAADGNTKFMLVLDHGDRQVDNGQRFKLCANTEAELQRWVDALSPLCAHAKANPSARLASPVRKGAPSSTGSLGDESDFADATSSTSGSGNDIRASSDSVTQQPPAALSGSPSPTQPPRRRHSASDASPGSPLSSGSGRKSTGSSSSPSSGSVGGGRGRPLGTGAAAGAQPPPLVEAAGDPAEPTMKKKLGRWSTTAPAAAAASASKLKLQHPAEAGGFLGSGGLLECALLLVAMNLCFAAVALGGARNPLDNSSSHDNNSMNGNGAERADAYDASDASSSPHHNSAGNNNGGSGSGGLGGASALLAVAWSAWWPAVVANFAAVAALVKLHARHTAAARAAQAQHEAVARARASAKVKARQKQSAAAAGGNRGGLHETGAGGVEGATVDSDRSSGEGGLVTPGKTIKRLDAGRKVGPDDMPSFTPGDLNSFEVRTVGYKKHGRKAPSSSPLYELVALDVFKTANKVDHIAEQIDLSSLDLPDTAHPDVPPLFLMNVQFPRSEDQKMFGAEDGPGCSVCFYFRIAPQTLAELHGPAELRSPALKLLAEWCRLAPDDPNFRGRFKAMGFIDDIEKYGLPSLSTRFNGKPVLIKKTGTLHRGAESYMEMDVNVFKFSYATRACLMSMKDRMASMVIRCGFTIEGRDDDELPEVLLGCANLNGVNLDAALDL